MKVTTQKQKRYKKQKSKKANINENVLKNLQAALNDNIKPERKEKRPNGKGKKGSGKKEVKSSN